MTITATTWVPRGFPAEHPQRYMMNDEEMERLNEIAKLQLEDAKEDLNEEKSKNADKLKDTEEIDEDLKEYNLESYDDEEDAQGQIMGMFGNAKALEYHENGENDAYVTMPNEGDEEEEREELQVFPTDNMILSTKTEDDISSLEVYIYNDDVEQDPEEGLVSKNDLYVHHDLMLPAEPLCVEWFDYKVGTNDETPGNFAAVGTFEPTIEIWDLDVVDAVFPTMVLGTEEVESVVKKAKKKKNSKVVNDKRHVDALLSLSSNRLQRNLLASASADTTVKLWDLATGNCVKSFQFHDKAVSCVAWNPKESTVLLTGGYDHKVIVSDVRVDGKEGQRVWTVDGDVENVKWASNGQHFYVACENGQLHKFDAKVEGKSLWTLQAHDNDITSFDVSEHIPDFMVTASQDKSVKLWNLANNKPSMILSRDLDIGKVFSVQFAPDPEVAGHITAAGTKGTVKVWDTMTNRFVRESVGKGMAELAKARAERGEKETIASVEVNDAEGSEDEDGFVDIGDEDEEDDMSDDD